MHEMSIEQEALGLLEAGASLEQIGEMTQALEICVSGMSFRRGRWTLSETVKRVLRNVPPSEALPRFERGLEVLALAKRLAA